VARVVVRRDGRTRPRAYRTIPKLTISGRIRVGTAKNRVHLDLRAAAGVPPEGRTDALEAECTRLVALGARRVRLLEADDINGACIWMEDPEGSEFCLD